MTLQSRTSERPCGLQITTTTPSGRKSHTRYRHRRPWPELDKAFAPCRRWPPTAYGGQRAAEPSHLAATRQTGPPRPATNHCQDPNHEKHHVDVACHCHPHHRDCGAQTHVEWTPSPGHTEHCHPCHEDHSAVVSRISPELPSPPDVKDATAPPPPRDALLPKRTPKLWVTNHHSVDQPSTVAEDAIHAMEPPAPRPLLHAP
jgi:hypothetical protein